MWAMMQKLRIRSGGVMSRSERSSVRLSYEGSLVDSPAHGQHQVPDQAEQDQRAPPRAQQGGALRPQDGGEEGPHGGGRRLRGAPRGLPSPGQGGLRRSPPQADGGPAQVSARPLGERRRLAPQAAASPPAISATS